MRRLLIAVALLVPSLCVFAQPAVGPRGDVPLVSVDDAPAFQFPVRRMIEGHTLILHAPQIRSWPEFKTFRADVAVELYLQGETTPHVGTAAIEGSTEVDLDARIVTVRTPKVVAATFPNETRAADFEETVKRAATRSELVVPLDIFLAHLADEVLETPPPPGFNAEPPPILVAKKPTLLLFVNGPAALAPLEKTGLNVVLNANWPTFYDPKSSKYFLLDRKTWMTSSKLESGWKTTTKLPAGFNQVSPEGEHAAVRAAFPAVKSKDPTPKVIFTAVPAELIVTDGKPNLVSIAGVEPLQYVSNTESPLFKHDDNWYFLVSGRWFWTQKLEKGPWRQATTLPEAFQQIPEDHALAAVRASVPGTVEARMAALEALLPTEQKAAPASAPPVEIVYGGEPSFEAIPGTPLTRATNTNFDVIQYQGLYYLCYQGVWYVAKSAVGPWAATADVPSVLYDIPPSSPSYHVTQVKVVESSSDAIVYSYPPSYSSSVYVVYGVPWYGTGWYYPPYWYGGYYYPYWGGSYGHGSWYNPATGRYGSRSVWYGPYGGYSYTRGYNPNTGRYGYVETEWDDDTWKSHGETYNPRTGVSTETSRKYNEDTNRMKSERTIERGDNSMTTNREIDFDEGTSRVERETSRGGSSDVTRTRTGDTISSSGTITTGDGRTATISGEQGRYGGQTTISGSQGSADMTTVRNDGRSVTSIEGSGGGQGVSVSGEGPGRTTIGMSGSGDLYAGHNGNVYKKTDDGWQHYENGEWQSAERPGNGDQVAPREGAGDRSTREGAAPTRQPADYSKQLDAARSERYSGGSARQGGSYGNYGGYGGSRDFRQLDRDYSARQRGNRQFQQRGGFQSRGFGGGGFRGGGGRRR